MDPPKFGWRLEFERFNGPLQNIGNPLPLVAAACSFGVPKSAVKACVVALAHAQSGER